MLIVEGRLCFQNLCSCGNGQNMRHLPSQQQLHMYFLQFSWAIPKEERCHIPQKVDKYNTAKLCTKRIRLPSALQMQRGRIAQHTYIQMHIHTTLHLLFSLCSLCLLNNKSAWRLFEFSDLLPALRTPLLLTPFTQNSSQLALSIHCIHKPFPSLFIQTSTFTMLVENQMDRRARDVQQCIKTGLTWTIQTTERVLEDNLCFFLTNTTTAMHFFMHCLSHYYFNHNVKYGHFQLTTRFRMQLLDFWWFRECF